MRCVLCDGVEDRGLLTRLGVRYGMENNFGSAAKVPQTESYHATHPPRSKC